MKKAKLAVLSLLLLIIALSAAAGVSGFWPGWLGKAGPAPQADLSAGTHPIAATLFPSRQTVSILALGAGLVVLAFYAKVKNGK
jgi:hypothetical protein